MLNWLSRIFSAEGLMPHGHCYLWDPGLVWLHTISDGLIFASYVSIPITLVYFINKRKDLPFSWIFGLFGVFIIACGTTHLMEIVTLYTPVYWLSGSIKVITAIASLGTAVLLVRLIPQALAIPSPQTLREANEALRVSLNEKEKLLREIEQVHRQLLEVSRKAGMADVATNLLHNVGNALNSINVSSELVTSTVRNSKVEGLSKAVALMQSQPDPKKFLTEDPRGQKLPEYFAAVAKTLAEDREQMLEELDALAKNVEHIKVIVSLQQSHAKATGVIERLSIAGLVEDSLKFNAASYDKIDVKVERHLDDVPEIQSDRHKLLQILMNLLSNARHAVMDADHERRITVRTAAVDDDKVMIEVEDNGVGIPAEIQEKIFVHGFTTKPGGHGFGLHSSACAAMELGGKLSLHSDGPGRGAKFTIIIPRRPTASGKEEA